MANFDDIDAINRFITGAATVNSKALKLQDDWKSWYNDLSWYSLHVSSDQTYDDARNRRNEFNIANTQSSAERDNAEWIAKSGYTTEEAAGEARRVLSTGRFPEQATPWIPTWAKYAAGAIAVGALGIVVAQTPQAIALGMTRRKLFTP